MYNGATYKYREWIADALDNGWTWEEIMTARTGSDEGLEIFLNQQNIYSFWSISVDEWKAIVLEEQEIDNNMKKIEEESIQATIMGDGESNNLTVPSDMNSSWQLYKNKLLNDGFKRETVNIIEKKTIEILRQLSGNTTQSNPVSGMVIGNVQSGKTANMSALMAMAADYGWNMFIILSGTIENLRKQTQNRLWSDLNQQGNLYWQPLDRPSLQTGLQTQDLYFSDGDSRRYFTVCLKNSTRLKHLIQWLQADKNKQKQMKILVIDDEADQASINTANVKDEEKERKKINGLICNLVSGKTNDGTDCDSSYRAMNYIGYTATPYANILNEPPEKTPLYPKNFITTLDVSKEYFGPQQIFGVEGGEYEGLDIVRIINNESLEDIRDIHKGYNSSGIPEELVDAIAWFLCGVSCFRVWHICKPVSMLVHTSQNVEHHKNIADEIKQWLNKTSKEDVIARCEKVWEHEIAVFSKEKFHEQYPDYGRKDEEIYDYPKFGELKKHIEVLLKKITNIPLDEVSELTYHDGIHLCIDNCKNNKIDPVEGMYMRLAYPSKEKMPEEAPAFIVVGGATLSRGLTIEGLISTFFLRSVSQADTLMQMGRWFGYRKGYELLPRIWLTQKTNEQFKFLSLLDESLRQEIYDMAQMGKTPAQYGPKVMNTPAYSFIKITAKNKMQSAEPSDWDFSGAFHQTYLFDDDEEILTSNLQLTKDFIDSLGLPEPVKSCNAHATHAHIWRSVPFENLKTFLSEFSFQSRLMVFNQIGGLIEWIEKATNEGALDNWNIVLSGKTSGEKLDLKYVSVGKIVRNRVAKQQYEQQNIINIGVLRDPRDLIVDVDLDGKDDSLHDRIINFKAKDAKGLRRDADLGTVPQLIIYIIDKESDTARNSETRKKLNVNVDIAGLCINIPGGKKGNDYAATISIPIENTIFDDDGDLEDINEN